MCNNIKNKSELKQQTRSHRARSQASRKTSLLENVYSSFITLGAIRPLDMEKSDHGAKITLLRGAIFVVDPILEMLQTSFSFIKLSIN